jgi:radial spoke head protein 9
MNIKNLEFELKYLNQVGASLDIDERIKLELALLNLTNIHPADQTLFWGKIEGYIYWD